MNGQVEPLLTLEQLATVLRVPVGMAQQWEVDGILPVESDAEGSAKYRQRNVVMQLRNYPEIMEAIKAAMRSRRGLE